MAQVTCPNCGAQIEDNLVKCPYCGYINEGAALKAHEDTINEIEDEIKDNIAEGDAAYTKTVVETSKSSVKGLFIVLGICALIALSFYIFMRFFDKGAVGISAKRSMAELAFQEANFDKWNEMYENGQYDELVKEFEAYDGEQRLFDYEHYYFLYAYSLYDRMKNEALPALDSKNASNKEKEALTYYACYFYYRSYDGMEGNYESASPRTTEKEKKILDEIRDTYMLDIIHNRMGVTDEELEALRSNVTEASGLTVRSTLGIKAKKFYKRYK